jgi:hypothetical protein
VTDCPHALTEFCSCIPRRAPVYTAPHVEMKSNHEREPEWRCQCMRAIDPMNWRGEGWIIVKPLLRNDRHTDPRGCISAEALASWRAQHPDCRGSDEKARALMWLDQEHGGAW